MAIKKKGEDNLYRQYPLKNNMTDSKKNTISTLLQKYQKISKLIQSDIINEFQKTGYINKYISYKDLPSYQKIHSILPKAVYIQMALTQVIEMLISRESNIQNTITLFIEKLKSQPNDSNLKHMLHSLNIQSKTKLSSSYKMVLGYQKGIENHIKLLNKNNLNIYKNKTDSDYRLGLEELKQSLKKEKITQEVFDNKEKILKENYQKRQSEEQKKINVISYNHQNKVITANKKEPITIPDTVYLLYKQIYKHVTKKWKYPSCKNISMRIDSRCMSIEKPEQAFQSGKILYWLKLNLIESITQINGKKKFALSIPLLKNEYFLSKKGILAQSIFIGKDRTGELFIRIMKNMTESIQTTKMKYQQMLQRKYNLNNSNKRLLALDFGLRVMFTDQEGNQYGRNWFSIVRQYDSLIQNRMKLLQEKEQNPKLSQDSLYVKLVHKCRDYIKNEINRVLTHIIETRNPNKLILENIKFINPDLSKSMNRLIQNCGRKVIGNKIKSLQEEYGLEVEYVNPAYTSQLCSCCGNIDKESRKGERYDCVGCGNKLNADVNAGRNILMRYLMNTVKVSLTPMEPCSIGLTMSKKSVRNAVTGISFLKMFHWIKNYYRLSIIAQEPMMGNCLNTD